VSRSDRDVAIVGGGVTGAPGHNCAREILRDLHRRLA